MSVWLCGLSGWLLKAAEQELINNCSVLYLSYSVHRTYFASVILQCILFVWKYCIQVLVVLYIIWGDRGCYFWGCVLRHVLSVGRVQTHGEGKRRRLEESGDCATTENLSTERAARQPSVRQEVKLASKHEQFKVEKLIKWLYPNHSWVNFCSREYSWRISRGFMSVEALHFLQVW